MGRLYVDSISRYNKVLRLVWSVVYFVFFKTTPRWAMGEWRIFLLKLFGAKIGRGCRVLPNCRIWAPWNLTMGDYSVLADGVDCYTMAEINIGNYVTISQRAFICTGSHDISKKNIPLVTAPVRIDDYAWVCAESFISPGVAIREGAVVGARSVVTRDVGSYEVVAGNPAKFIKQRIFDLEGENG